MSCIEYFRLKLVCDGCVRYFCMDGQPHGFRGKYRESDIWAFRTKEEAISAYTDWAFSDPDSAAFWALIVEKVIL